MTRAASRSSGGWSVRYTGLTISGGYNDSRTKYAITITPNEGALDTPGFTLQLPGLLRLTSIVLPGSTAVVQLTSAEEVSVHLAEGGGEAERVNRFASRLVAGEAYVNIVEEFRESGNVYCVEARCGHCQGEGFIVCSVYKFLAGAVGSEVSECAYERVLDGL